MTKEEFLVRLKEDESFSPGWQAIDEAFEKLYPGQTPEHFGTLLTARAAWGGDDYLDGFSIYSSCLFYTSQASKPRLFTASASCSIRARLVSEYMTEGISSKSQSIFWATRRNFSTASRLARR